MATETISWNSIVGGTSAVMPNEVIDNGNVMVGLASSSTAADAVTVNTTATDPDNNTSNPDNSQLSMAASTGNPTTVTVNFADDTSNTAEASGAYDATFGINDIDAGTSSSSGFRDSVTIKALDADGNPLQINVSSNSNYTVTQNSDGTVTIKANYGTNSWNDAASYAQVSVVGGPIASISVELENDGIGGNNIMLTDISYNADPLCFVAGTLIDTDKGPVAVEDLMVGDMVRTRDNGFQPVRWSGMNTLSGAALSVSPQRRPIRIAAGALGDGSPARDLLVSPQHRILVRSRIAQKMFGTDEVLVAAKQLVMLDGIDYCDAAEGVDYVHFLCDRHEVVFANGCEAETLFTGPEALKTVGRAAREEIFAIFPELRDADYQALSARVLASGRLGRKLACRHAQNDKPLVQ